MRLTVRLFYGRTKAKAPKVALHNGELEKIEKVLRRSCRRRSYEYQHRRKAKRQLANKNSIFLRRPRPLYWIGRRFCKTLPNNKSFRGTNSLKEKQCCLSSRENWNINFYKKRYCIKEPWMGQNKNPQKRSNFIRQSKREIKPMEVSKWNDQEERPKKKCMTCSAKEITEKN